MKRIITIALLSIISIVAFAQHSEGGASVELKGRNVVGTLPKPSNNAQQKGTVVVQIKVDQYGNVTEAIPGFEGTTVTDKGLWNAARAAAMKAHFNVSADAPVLQTGTISYTFLSSGSTDTDESALKFVGVPIDGTKEQMIEALEEKGFQKEPFNDSMATGMFNGELVTLFLSTNHGIVDRVKVVYPRCNAANDTRVKYNMLLSRFNRNAKYVCVNTRPEVPADENIYLKLQANTKEYDAVYFFLHPEVNAKGWVEEFKREYQKLYKKPLQGLSYEEMEEALFCLPMKVSAAVSGVVWFTMTSVHDININYINFKNRPHGEDL